RVLVAVDSLIRIEDVQPVEKQDTPLDRSEEVEQRRRRIVRARAAGREPEPLGTRPLAAEAGHGAARVVDVTEPLRHEAFCFGKERSDENRGTGGRAEAGEKGAPRNGKRLVHGYFSLLPRIAGGEGRRGH